MKLIKSKKSNINYLAKIVSINTFEKHPNADALKCAMVDGYRIIVGLDEPEGLYIYFPTSCELNPNLIAFANLYRHKEKNSNPETKPGFFEDNGRVKAIKLRGVVSEGFLMPTYILQNFIESSVNQSIDLNDFINTEFDTYEHDGKEFWICKKYVVQRTPGAAGSRNERKRQSGLKKFDRIIDTQFKFHYDTVLVRKEPWCITPNDLISLTYKIHGTSGISAYVLCKQPLNFAQKVFNWAQGNGWKNYSEKYDYIYASRSVIKNQYFNEDVGLGYYGEDVWAEADKIVRPNLIKGMTAYYEIIGFLPSGRYIQKNYDYGCVPPKEGETYTHNKHFKVRIYRLTLTNVDGIVHEFSAREVQQWCNSHNLIPVEECYYGLAGDLYEELRQFVNGEPMYPEDWNQQFWDMLANDKNFYMEMNSPDCNNNVPHEGLVIKKEDMISRAWKLKCFAFLQGEAKELDAGESNIEDES